MRRKLAKDRRYPDIAFAESAVAAFLQAHRADFARAHAMLQDASVRIESSSARAEVRKTVLSLLYGVRRVLREIEGVERPETQR
ncbi:MAG: hypothetical protein ACRD0K_10035 [Egibacteraceae bacterium]